MTHHLRRTSGYILGIALHAKRGKEPPASHTAMLGVRRLPEGGGATILSFRWTTTGHSPHFPRLKQKRTKKIRSQVVQHFVCSQEHPVGSTLLRGEEAEGGGRGMNKK